MSSRLHIQGINKIFGRGQRQVEVLKHIDIDVQAGEFLILVGASGCGKSTLLNIIAGLETPTNGSIMLDDIDITHKSPKDRDIAMVFQSYALYPTMSVADNIGFALEMRGVNKADRLARIKEVSNMLQIEPLLERKPKQLSGGQRQRVAMGRALARHPSLFLFDEPLSNLDAKLRVEMRAEIKRIHKTSGITSVYVTHDQTEAMTLGTRIAIMDKGVLQQLDTPEQVYHQPANMFVAGFIGSPAINFLSGEIQNAKFIINGEMVCSDIAAQQTQNVVMGIRPEHIRLHKESAADIEVRGMIYNAEHTGADSFITVDSPIGQLKSRVPIDRSLLEGDNIVLYLDTEQLYWFDGDNGKRIYLN